MTDSTPAAGAKMIDVSAKDETLRTAVAACTVRMQASTYDVIKAGQIKKGDVFEVARVAGIMAAKNTPALLPLCHPIRLQSVKVSFHPLDGASFEIRCEAKGRDVTGVEMEALCAVSAAALCVYDMCKYLDKGIVIDQTRLLSKTGGKSGDFQRAEP